MAEQPAGRRPILVTGAFRSGTTWVGRGLAAAPGVGYIHEPSNPDFASGSPWPRPFTCVTAENEGPYLEWIRDFTEFRCRAPRFRRLKHLSYRLSEMSGFLRWRLRRPRPIPLFKDPLALFSAEWMAERFGMRVVCMIRHPAGFVSSLQRLTWWFFDFRLCLEQPLLMRDLLTEFEPEIRACGGKHPGSLEAGILLYRMFHAVIDRYRQRHPDWIFVRHDDLARDPLAGFEALYGQLGLRFTGAARRWVVRNCGEGNPGDRPAHEPDFTRRNSRATLSTWRNRMSPEEIARVREATADVWTRFYTDSDW